MAAASSLLNPGGDGRGGRGLQGQQDEDSRRTRRKILEREVLDLMIQKKEQEKGEDDDDEYEEVIFDPVKAALETNALMKRPPPPPQPRNRSSLRRKSNSDSDLYVMDENREIELCSRIGLDRSGLVAAAAADPLPDDATFCNYAEPEQGFYRVYDDLERIREWDLIPYVIARKRREEEEREEISSSNKDPATEKEVSSKCVESHPVNTCDDSGRESVISRLSGSTVRSKRVHSDSGSNCSADSGTYHLFDSKARLTSSSAAATEDARGIKPVNDVLALVSDELLKIAANGAEKADEEEDEVICSSSSDKRVVLKLSPKFVRDKPHPPTPPVSLRKPPLASSVSQTESTNPIAARLKMFEKEFHDKKPSSSSSVAEQRRGCGGALVKRSNGFSCPSSRAGHVKQQEQQKQNISSPPPPPLPPRSSLKTNSSSSSTSTFGSSSSRQQKRKDLSSYFGLLQDDQNLPYSKEVAQTVALQSLSTNLNNAGSAVTSTTTATATTPPGKKDLNKFLGIHSQVQKKKEEEVVSSSSSSMLLSPSSLLKRFSPGGKNCRQQKGQQQQQQQELQFCNNSKEMQNALHPAGLNATLMQRDQFANAPTSAGNVLSVAAPQSSSSSSEVQSSQSCIKPPSGVMQIAPSKREKGSIPAAETAQKEIGTPTLRRRIFRNPLRSAVAAASTSKRRSEITCPAIQSAVAGERARTPSPYRLKNTPLRRFKSKEYTPRKSFMANLLLSGGNKQRQTAANLNMKAAAQTVARQSVSSEEEDVTEMKSKKHSSLPVSEQQSDDELLEACQRDYSASVNEALKDGLPVIPFCQLHDMEENGRLMQQQQQQQHCKGSNNNNNKLNNCFIDSDGEDNKENDNSGCDLVAVTPFLLSSQLQQPCPHGASTGPAVPRKAPGARRSLFFPSPPPPAAKRQQSSLYLTMSTVKANVSSTRARTAGEEHGERPNLQNGNQMNEDKKKIHCRSCTCDLVSPPLANTFPHRIRGGGGEITVGSGSCSSRSGFSGSTKCSVAAAAAAAAASSSKNKHCHRRHRDHQDEELLKQQQQQFEWEDRSHVELDYMRMETATTTTSHDNKFGGVGGRSATGKKSTPWKRKSLTSLLLQQ